MKATFGADAQCNYRFGFYFNTPRPSSIEGCRYKTHPPKFSASAEMTLKPYITVAPRVEIALGDSKRKVYGEAIAEATAALPITASLKLELPSNSFSVSFIIDLVITINLKFNVGWKFCLLVIPCYEKKIPLGSFKLAQFKWNLAKINAGAAQKKEGTVSRASSPVTHLLPSPEAPPCECFSFLPYCKCCNCMKSSQQPQMYIRPAISSRASADGKVKALFMYIPDRLRFEQNTNIAVLFSFVCSNRLAAADRVTVNYPVGFFTAGPSSSPVANPANVEGLSYQAIQSANPSSSSFVFSVDRPVNAQIVFIVTIYGLSLGNATPGSPFGISFQTSADPAPSDACSTGSILQSKMMAAGFEIDIMHRIQYRASVPAVLKFTTFAPLPSGGRITVMYPTGFFAAGPSTNLSFSNIAGLDTITLQPATAFSSSFVISISGSGIKSNSNVVITLAGMTMGNATNENTKSCTLKSSADPQPSDPFDSGFILSQPVIGQVTSPQIVQFLTTPRKHFFSLNNITLMVLQFTTRSRIEANGDITVQFPAGYFVAGPAASSGADSTFTIVRQPVSALNSSTFSIQTSRAVASFTAVTVTLYGLTLGESTANAPVVTLATSADPVPSPIANFRRILPARSVTYLTIKAGTSAPEIAQEDGLPQTLTIRFFAQTAIAIGGKMTIQFPSGFFFSSYDTLDTGSSPVVFLNVGTWGFTEFNESIPNARLENITSNRIIIRSLIAIPSGAQTSDNKDTVLIMIKRLYLSDSASSAAAGSFEVLTDNDFNPSEAVPVSSVFSVIKRNQAFSCSLSCNALGTDAAASGIFQNFAGNTVDVTLRFKSANNQTRFGRGSGTGVTQAITVVYPAGFFTSGPVTVSDILQAGAQGNLTRPVVAVGAGSTFVLRTSIDLAGLPLLGYYSYTVTLYGMKLGSATPAGSAINLFTSLDPDLSPCTWTEEYSELRQPTAAPIRSWPMVLSPAATWSSSSSNLVARRSANVSFAFSTVTAIKAGNISIQLPAGLIQAVPSPPRLCWKSGVVCFKSVTTTGPVRSQSASSDGFEVLVVQIPPATDEIGAQSRVTIDFFDVVIGSSLGSSQGITITTTSHTLPSDVIPIPTIVPNCVFPPNLIIASQFRQSGRTQVPITLSFVPQSDLPSSSTITVTFPPFMFVDGPLSNPSATVSVAGSAATISVTTLLSAADSPSYSSFVVAIGGALVPKFSFVSLVLDGLTIGNPTRNVPNGIRITTSADSVSCIGADTGVILEQPSTPPYTDADGKDPCDCKTNNATVAYNNAAFAGSIQTSSSNWQIFNATQVDTCDYSVANVAAFTTLFVVPTTGFYSLRAAVSDIPSTFNSSSWNFMARTVEASKGSGCCGNTAFCGALSSSKAAFTSARLFLQGGDTISIVWTVDVVGGIAPSATILLLVQAIREPVVYVDVAQGRAGNKGTYDAPVASFQEGLYALAALVASLGVKNGTATMYVRPSAYGQNKPHVPLLATGFVIPTQLKGVSLVISSVVAQAATSLYTAFQEQSYCNYLINQCTSQSRFFEASYGTAMDTEIAANATLSGRAFTLRDMASLTLQGFTIQNFANRGDGGAFHVHNSTLILQNCMLKGNSAIAYGNGGAIFATKQSLVVIQNSIFLGHRARGSGGIVYANAGSVLVVDKSILQGACKLLQRSRRNFCG